MFSKRIAVLHLIAAAALAVLLGAGSTTTTTADPGDSHWGHTPTVATV